MITDDTKKEMAARAMAWLAPPPGKDPITRDAAINEQIMALDVIDLLEALDHAEGPHCTSCGNAIDPDLCWCGDGPADKHFDETHPFIPMGCDCARGERDWKKLASARGERLWQALRDLDAARKERDEAQMLCRDARIQAMDRGASYQTAVAARDEAEARLARMEPLRTVLRSWDWAEIAKDGRLPSDTPVESRVIAAFAAVERAFKEGGNG